MQRRARVPLRARGAPAGAPAGTRPRPCSDTTTRVAFSGWVRARLLSRAVPAQSTAECKPCRAHLIGAVKHVVKCRVNLVPQNLCSTSLAPVARGGWRSRTRVGTLMHAPQSPERNPTRTTGSHSAVSGVALRRLRVPRHECGACSCATPYRARCTQALAHAHSDTRARSRTPNP